MLYYNDPEEVGCFDVRLKTEGAPLTYVNDGLTEHVCKVANVFNSRNRDDISMPVQIFLKTLLEIATQERGFDGRANYVVIEQRLFVKNGKMYCKIPKNFTPVYEFVYERFTNF